MARGVNKVILLGHLGKDPEVRYSPNGTAIANMSLATSEQWKDKNSGEKQERTEWHRLVMFGRTAEIAKEYLKKGAQIYVEGRIQTRKWQDKEGRDQYTTEIVVNEFQMLGRREQSEEQPRAAEQQSRASSDGASAYRATSGGSSVARRGPTADEPFDDEIPF